MEVQKVKMYAMYCSAPVHRAVALSIVVIVRSKFLFKNAYVNFKKWPLHKKYYIMSDLHILCITKNL